MVIKWKQGDDIMEKTNDFEIVPEAKAQRSADGLHQRADFIDSSTSKYRGI